MKTERYHTFVVLLILLVVAPIQCFGHGIGNDVDMMTIGHSCTIFTVALGDTVLFGNNEDYLRRDLYQWFIPAQELAIGGGESRSIHGAVFVGFVESQGGGTYPQGGMNEYGLVYDTNGLPAITVNQNSSGLSFYSGGYVLCQSLWECKSVPEVIQWYLNHRWEGPVGGQIHYADAAGDAVVVSVNPSTSTWSFTHMNTSFLVSTNFNLNDSSNANFYPCSRYNTATQMLDAIANEEDLTVQACADVLYAVHQEGLYGTRYSNIFDPVNRYIYYNFGDHYQNQTCQNLMEILGQEDAFERMESFLGLTGIDGHIKVKTIEVNESFYTPLASFSSLESPSPPASLYMLIIIPLVIVVIPLVIYHKRRKHG